LLIVGAGPTGLAMALFALRAGLAPRVVDAAAGPSRFSKAVGLQYRVSELLAYLGLAEKFRAAGTEPVLVNMFAGEKRLLSLAFADFSDLAGRGAFVPVGIMIPQSETERLLGEALAAQGGAVEWGTSLVGISQTDSEVTATLRRADGRKEEAGMPWLVGCDGAHSAVRKLAGLTFEGKSYPLAFVIADVESRWPSDHDVVHVWFHADGSAAAMPLPGAGRWRLFVETTRQKAPAGEISFADICRLMAERTGARGVDFGECLWRSEFRINCRMVDRFQAGRVFVAGDAAHIHSPTGGQGITTGLQDAANLAWKLGRIVGGAPPALLETYSAERLAHARAVLAETDRNTRVFIAPTPALRLLRDRLVLPLLRRPGMQRRLVRRLSQLDMNYRESPLSRHESSGWSRGPAVRAGDRAPDVTFRLGAAERTLFSLLRPGRFVALLGAHAAGAASTADSLRRIGIDAYRVADDRAASDQEWTLIDAHGDFGRLYRMRGDFICMVRPDGYVGLFQRPIRVAALRRWLVRLFSLTSVAAAFGAFG
jgi:2-polyprenyl-6-methoxyphenol hydroxylase-like FAD-dependent oxidoreductase